MRDRHGLKGNMNVYRLTNTKSYHEDIENIIVVAGSENEARRLAYFGILKICGDFYQTVDGISCFLKEPIFSAFLSPIWKNRNVISCELISKCDKSAVIHGNYKIG